MGADCNYRWVKTIDIGKYDWSNGWIRLMKLPEVPIELWDDTPGFEDLECFILGLLEGEQGIFLSSDKGDFVFNCNISIIDKMIEKCRRLIHELIDLNDDEYKRGMEIAHIFYNEYYEWDGELAEKLCRTLMQLKEARGFIQKHPSWSLIVEIAY